MNSFTNELIETMFALSRSMKERMSYSNEFANLSMLQIQVLISIKKKGSEQMTDIAQMFNIELPSATSLINKLTTLKLVERKSDEADRRLVKIVLTRKGGNMLEKIMKDRSKNIKKMLSLLSESDKKDLLRISKTILKQMNTTYEK